MFGCAVIAEFSWIHSACSWMLCCEEALTNQHCYPNFPVCVAADRIWLADYEVFLWKMQYIKHSGSLQRIQFGFIVPNYTTWVMAIKVIRRAPKETLNSRMKPTLCAWEWPSLIGERADHRPIRPSALYANGGSSISQLVGLSSNSMHLLKINFEAWPITALWQQASVRPCNGRKTAFYPPKLPVIKRQTGWTEHKIPASGASRESMAKVWNEVLGDVLGS